MSSKQKLNRHSAPTQPSPTPLSHSEIVRPPPRRLSDRKQSPAPLNLSGNGPLLPRLCSSHQESLIVGQRPPLRRTRRQCRQHPAPEHGHFLVLGLGAKAARRPGHSRHPLLRRRVATPLLAWG